MQQKQQNEAIWVIIQAILFVIIIALAQLDTVWVEDKILRFSYATSFLCGLLLCFCGIAALNKNLTAFPTPKEGSALLKGGVFRFIRHPMYSGMMLCASSYALISGNMPMLLVSVLVVLFFLLKAQKEERNLVKIYPDYADYQQKTKKFIPFLY